MSHAGDDRDAVLELVARMRKHGLKVWLYEEHNRAGEYVEVVVNMGLDQSRNIVFCMTPAALKSANVTAEITSAGMGGFPVARGKHACRSCWKTARSRDSFQGKTLSGFRSMIHPNSIVW